MPIRHQAGDWPPEHQGPHLARLQEVGGDAQRPAPVGNLAGVTDVAGLRKGMPGLRLDDPPTVGGTNTIILKVFDFLIKVGMLGYKYTGIILISLNSEIGARGSCASRSQDL